MESPELLSSKPVKTKGIAFQKQQTRNIISQKRKRKKFGNIISVYRKKVNILWPAVMWMAKSVIIGINVLNRVIAIHGLRRLFEIFARKVSFCASKKILKICLIGRHQRRLAVGS
jgi:hypothetical protein